MQSKSGRQENRTSIAPWRWLLIAAGSICVGLAAAGVFLPLLPTTPFLLLAAACFARSSPRLDRWLHANRLFGGYLTRYRRGEGLSFPAKFAVLALLWLSVGTSSLFAVPAPLWPVRLLLVFIAIAVTIHIARIPTSQQAGKPR